MFVLGFGLGINFIAFTIVRKRGLSMDGSTVFDPQNSKIDWKLVLGAFCFGVGWGLGGLCPGPFLVLFADFTIEIQVIWGAFLAVGMYSAESIL